MACEQQLTGLVVALRPYSVVDCKTAIFRSDTSCSMESDSGRVRRVHGVAWRHLARDPDKTLPGDNRGSLEHQCRPWARQCQLHRATSSSSRQFYACLDTPYRQWRIRRLLLFSHYAIHDCRYADIHKTHRSIVQGWRQTWIYKWAKKPQIPHTGPIRLVSVASNQKPMKNEQYNRPCQNKTFSQPSHYFLRSESTKYVQCLSLFND